MCSCSRLVDQSQSLNQDNQYHRSESSLHLASSTSLHSIVTLSNSIAFLLVMNDRRFLTLIKLNQRFNTDAANLSLSIIQRSSLVDSRLFFYFIPRAHFRSIIKHQSVTFKAQFTWSHHSILSRSFIINHCAVSHALDQMPSSSAWRPIICCQSINCSKYVRINQTLGNLFRVSHLFCLFRSTDRLLCFGS